MDYIFLKFLIHICMYSTHCVAGTALRASRESFTNHIHLLPLKCWQLYFTTQKATNWFCQKKSAVWWLAEWAKQNTISGMDFHARFLFLWTTQWQNDLLISNDPLRKSDNHKRLTSAWEAILHHRPRSPEILVCHDKCYWALLCTHGSCTHVTHMVDAQSKQESARGWWW